MNIYVGVEIISMLLDLTEFNQQKSPSFRTNTCKIRGIKINFNLIISSTMVLFDAMQIILKKLEVLFGIIFCFIQADPLMEK